MYVTTKINKTTYHLSLHKKLSVMHICGLLPNYQYIPTTESLKI